MSVYTSVSDDEMRVFLTHYALGELISLKGIAQGVTNSNYFLTTTTGRYILTIFETMTVAQLPFFLNLTQHLSQHGVACPAPMMRSDGTLVGILAEKPACLVSCLAGQDTDQPNANQCFNTGAMLARMHLASADFSQHMSNSRYRDWWQAASIRLQPYLTASDWQLLSQQIVLVNQYEPTSLPSGIIHADLFKDNVLLNGDQVAGFIDFYYACCGHFVYDLAIAINDWARDADHGIDELKSQAFMAGYQQIRPLTATELAYFPVAQRAACIRFWVSRLLDYHFPQAGEMTFIKDPNAFRDLLLSLPALA